MSREQLTGFFSLRRTLTGAILLLGLALTAVLGHQAFRAKLQLDGVRAEAEEMMGAVRFGTGLAALLTERQSIMNALLAEGADDAVLRTDIARHRQATSGLEAGLPALLRIAPGSAQNRIIEAMMREYPVLRAAGERLLTQPRPARDAAAIRRFQDETRRLITAAGEAWLTLLPRAAGQEAALLRRGDLLALSWRLRDLAGHTRSAIADALVAGEAPDTAVLARIAEAQGGAKALLKSLDTHARSGLFLPVAVQAIDRAQARFQAADGFDALAGQIVAAWGAGQVPGMDLPRWMDASNAAFDEIIAVMASTEAGVRRFSNQNTAAAQTTMWVQLGFALLGLGFAAFLTVLISLRVARPLDGLATTIKRLAGGEEGLAIPSVARRDEIGVLARAMAAFQVQQAELATQRQAAEVEREEARTAQDAALSDMANTIEAQTRGGFAQITERMVAVTAETQGIAAGAERISSAGEGAAQAASHALAASETVAAAAEQMAASIREISTRMSDAAHLTETAVAGTRSGTGTVRGLAEAVQRIGKVAEMISDIAARTNLLALNATIEAARAGEAGKGFAVVASEVKSLANQTARATQEIGQQIAEVQAETSRAVEAISRIGQTVEGLEQIAAGVAAAMVEQSAATQEIARAVAGSAEAAREVSDRVGSLGREAGEAAGRAERMRESAHSASLALDEVRGTLVRTVRECSDTVQRRKAPRFPTRATGRLSFQGHVQDVTILDLSETGAGLETVPGLARGARVTLSISGLAGSLSGQVVQTSEARTGIALALTAAQQQSLRGFLPLAA